MFASSKICVYVFSMFQLIFELLFVGFTKNKILFNRFFSTYHLFILVRVLTSIGSPLLTISCLMIVRSYDGPPKGS